MFPTSSAPTRGRWTCTANPVECPSIERGGQPCFPRSRSDRMRRLRSLTCSRYTRVDLPDWRKIPPLPVRNVARRFRGNRRLPEVAKNNGGSIYKVERKSLPPPITNGNHEIWLGAYVSSKHYYVRKKYGRIPIDITKNNFQAVSGINH